MNYSIEKTSTGNARIVVDNQTGEKLLISYTTPVAWFCPKEKQWYRTEVRFSRSTEAHIRKFADYGSGGPCSQENLDETLRRLTGFTRLGVGIIPAQRAGTLANTRGVDYSAHTEAGDDNLVVPVYRRHRFYR